MDATGQKIIDSDDKPAWLARALDVSTPTTEARESVRTASMDGRLFPTIRMMDGKLTKFESVKAAHDYAIKAGDFIQFESDDAATAFSKSLSKLIGDKRSLLSRSGD